MNRLYGASDLEQEFELEFDEGKGEVSYEFDDNEFERESSEDVEAEYELGLHESLGARLAGLAAREFEAEGELDEALNEAFEEAQDRFIGKALRKVGKFAKKAAPILLKGPLNLDSIKKLLPTDLLKKSLITAAKAAMASNPALAALAPALGPALASLGLEQEFEDPDREAWESFEVMGEAAYEHLVGNLSDKAAVQPLAAMQLAAGALKAGAQQARIAAPGGGTRRPGGGGGHGRAHVVRLRGAKLRPGDKIVIRVV